MSCLLLSLTSLAAIAAALSPTGAVPSAHRREQATGQPKPTTNAVVFKTSDGGMIEGDLYGSGGRGVVLAHGGRFNKESWSSQAEELARAGFRVLAFNFRGYGKSQGPGQADISAPLHLDVLAAADYLRSRGASPVSAVGGSFGGGAIAAAVMASPRTFDRIVLLGATPDGPADKLTGPKLYIMTRDDTSGDGPRLPGLQAHVAKAPEPKELIVLEGSAHAQFMFQTEHGPRVMKEILRFLAAR
jgi:pimeloyl-ACP methyl ester carboxylesterase